MKIIFIGVTGVHHVLIATYIYLNKNETDNMFLSTDFCDMSKDKLGYPIYIGRDDFDNEVYTLGVGYDVKMGERTLTDLREILGFSETDLIIERIPLKREWIILLISKIPPVLGLGLFHNLVAKTLIRTQLSTIKKHMKQFKTKLNNITTGT